MGHPAHERPGFHGMVLVGQRRAYLSHLPMFMSPHDYQAVFEVTLTTGGADAFPAYLQDRSTNPPGSTTRPNTESRMYGFAPTIDPDDGDPLTDLFILSDLMTPSDPHDPSSAPIRTAFTGTVFRGHFEDFHPHEKEGPAILSGVVAHVANPVLFRKFDPHATRPPQLPYFLFGSSGDLYLAHAVSGAPDFDQILAVEVDGHPLVDADLRRAVPVAVPGRSDTAEDRLRPGETAPAQLSAPAEGGTRAVPVNVHVRAQEYFETDDLKSGPGHHHM
jgi:hypothetical protein